MKNTIMKTCPICSSELHLKYQLSAEIYHCNSCDLYVAPEVSFDKSFESEYNQEKGGLALKDLRISNFKVIIGNLKKELKSNARGLEIGCSYGWFLDACKANGISCIAIEPEPHLVKYSKNIGHTVIQGFFPEDLGSQEKDFDFIIFNDVFEHIPDIKKTLESCYQLLAPGGTMIINLPLSTGIFYKIGGFLYKLNRKKPMERLWQLQYHSPHFHYFNKSNLTRLAESKGFSLSNFHHLPTLTKDSIKSRIEMDKKQTFSSKLTIAVLKLLFPLIGKLPSDIGCFYFKKA
jgi:SAM-dependent methyltransferase